MIEGPTLYELLYFVSSKLFVTRVFCDYVITLSTDISRDWSKIETIWNHFCPQSRLFPSDWCHCRVDHVTILLPVWRFWPFGVAKTVENGGNGDVPGRGTCQKLKHLRTVSQLFYTVRNPLLTGVKWGFWGKGSPARRARTCPPPKKPKFRAIFEDVLTFS